MYKRYQGRFEIIWNPSDKEIASQAIKEVTGMNWSEGDVPVEVTGEDALKINKKYSELSVAKLES